MSAIKHRPAKAKVIVVCLRKDKVLLIRRKGAKWKFPSGLISAGEAPLVTAARELWTELSLRSSGLQAVGIIEIGSVIHHLYTTDLPDSCRAIPCGRVVACKWAGWDELNSTLLKPTAAALSRSLSAMLNHDGAMAQDLGRTFDAR